MIIHRSPTGLHTDILGHLFRFKVRRYHTFLRTGIGFRQRNQVLLEGIVPHGIAHARNSSIKETHLIHRRVISINRNVDAINLIVPQYGIHHQGIFVHIQSTRTRGSARTRICPIRRVIVRNSGMQHHPSPVAIYGTIFTARIVTDHRSRQYQIFRMPPVKPGFMACHVYSASIVCRIISQHRPQDNARIVHVNTSSATIGIVIINQRTAHTSAFHIYSASVPFGRILRDNTIIKVGISLHIDTAPSVAVIIPCIFNPCTSSLNGHPIKYRGTSESTPVHTGKPYYMTGIATAHRPFLVIFRPYAFPPRLILTDVTGPFQYRQVLVFPRHAAVLKLTLSLAGLCPGKTTINVDTFFHDESRSVLLAVLHQLRRSILSLGYPDLARLSGLGQTVDGCLHIRKCCLPTLAIGTDRRSPLLDTQYPFGRYRLKLVCTDVYPAIRKTWITGQVNFSIIRVDLVGTFVYKCRALQHFPCPNRISIIVPIEITVETRLLGGTGKER